MTSVTLEQALAATRFGFGASPSDFSAIGADAKAWLKGQLQAGTASNYSTPLPSTSEFLELAWGGVSSPTMAAAGVDTATLFDYEIGVRTKFGARTSAPYRERWARFWSNHFSATGRGEFAGIIGAFEREVIRPNVMARFEDMLVASSTHPAMIWYLENLFSRGQNSVAQQGLSSQGLNENLAREILELHTLGFDGGYSQADVRSFANVLTGWTFSDHASGKRPYGVFNFNPDFHEPSAQTVFGVTYSQTGVDQGLAVLHDLAMHASTINHVCTKIAQHFHSDNPPQSLIDQLKAAWTNSGGDLGVISAALVDAPEMWVADQMKIKTVDDYWTSMLRAVDPQWPADWGIMWMYIMLGAPPFGASSPAGYPMDSGSWSGAGQIRQRLQTTGNLADGFAPTIGDIGTLAQNILGPLLRPATLNAIGSAPSAPNALTILFMSPEFQRR